MALGNLNVDTITTSTSGGVLGAGNASIMKNRLINGACVIDQRYAGSAASSSYSGYVIDRWSVAQVGTTGKIIAQQNAGSVTPPIGFTNYLGITSQSSYTVGTNEFYSIVQTIEGYNIADLGWGTANAKTITVSFWVQSSLTGTFGGCLNNGGSRSYPFTYTISSANTWEQKSVTIAGDTSGTWGTTTGIGVQIWFNLGCGSTYSGTAGAWASANKVAPTGAVSVVGTSGATFYLTGVQFEIGSSATGFEYRIYGTELANCQRYYWKKAGQYPSANTTVGAGMLYSANDARACLANPVPMRIAPAITFSGSGFGFERPNTFLGTIGSPAAANYSPEASLIYSGSGTSSGTAGDATFWYITDNTSYIAVNSEL